LKQTTKMSTEEEDVFASLGAARSAASAYESELLKKASYQMAPTLVLNDEGSVGFPDLASTTLLPFSVQTQAKANRQAILRVLSALQTQMEAAVKDNNSNGDSIIDPDDLRVMAIKQQMLLSMLGKQSKKPAIQQLWKQQASLEEAYRIQEQQSHRKVATRKKPRISMMQRKQIPGAANVVKAKNETQNKRGPGNKKSRWKNWSSDEDSISTDDEAAGGGLLLEMNYSSRRQNQKQPAAAKTKKVIQAKKGTKPATNKSRQIRARESSLAQSSERPKRKRTIVSSYREGEDDYEDDAAGDKASATLVVTDNVSTAEDKKTSCSKIEIKREEEDNIAPVATAATGPSEKDASQSEVPIKQEEEEIALSAAGEPTVTAETPTNDNPPINNVKIKQEEDAEENQESVPQVSTVTCPLCQATLDVPDPSEVDSELSRHMAQCQTNNNHGTRRSRRLRQTPTRTSYKETDENDFMDEDEDDGASKRPQRRGSKRKRATSATVPNNSKNDGEDEEFVFDDEVDSDDQNGDDAASNKKEPPIRSIKKEEDDNDFVFDNDMDEDEDLEADDEPLLTQPKAKDDYRLDDYEDRVDYWRLHGVNEMRDMSKLRAEGEMSPGAITLEGGLHIPAWMNDRLFGYQRTGLEWMWALHQQEAGGVSKSLHIVHWLYGFVRPLVF
jgi:hypothetical protein